MAEDRPIVKVVVCVPNEGHTVPPAYDNHMLFNQHLGGLQERSKAADFDGPVFQFFHFTAGRLLTPAAREALAEEALKAGMDYMLMIDDDMILPHDLFEKLYRHGVEIVAPLAFTRNPPHYPVLYRQEKGFDPVTQSEYFINHYVRNYPKDSLIRCDAVGFGAALVKVDVLNRMKKPWFMSTCGTGEDVLFCYKAYQEAGAVTYMDTSTKLGHLGAQIVIDEPYAEGYWKQVEGKDIARENTQPTDGVKVLAGVTA